MAKSKAERDEILSQLKKLNQWKKDDFIKESDLPAEELSEILWQGFRDGVWGEHVSGSGKMREEHELLASYAHAATPADALLALGRFEQDYLWHDVTGWDSKAEKIFDQLLLTRPEQLEAEAALFKGWMAELLEMCRFRAGRAKELSEPGLRRLGAAWLSSRYNNRFLEENRSSLPPGPLGQAALQVGSSGEIEIHDWAALEEARPHGTAEQGVLAALYYRGDDRHSKALAVAREHGDVALETLASLLPKVKDLDSTVRATFGVVLTTLLQDRAKDVPEELDGPLSDALVFCHDEHDLELTRAVFTKLAPARAVRLLKERLYRRALHILPAIADDDESLLDAALAKAEEEYQRPHIIAGLSGCGERVLPKLCGIAQSKKPGTGLALVAAGALGEIDSPKAADALVQLLGHGSKGVREAATTALGKLGETARAALEQGCKARKKAVSEACQATLDRLAVTAKVTDSPLGKLRSEVSPELQASLIKALDDSYDPHSSWASRNLAVSLVKEHGDKLFMATCDWFVEALQGPRSYQATEVWMAALEALPEPGAAAWPVCNALARLPKLQSWTIRQVPEHMVKAFGPESARAAAQALSAHNAVYREPLYTIAATDPGASLAVLIEGLGDSSKGVRALCVEALGKGAEEAVDQLLPLLASKKKDIRFGAASALGKIGSSAAAGSLRAALAKEKAEDVRTALEDALRACGDGGAEAAEYPADAAGWEQLLSTQRKVRLPKLLSLADLPPLRFKGGAVLTDQALCGLLGKVIKEAADRTDPLLWALRPALDDEDCNAFGIALKDQWAKGGGSAQHKWAVFQQAIFCNEARLNAVAPRLDEITEMGNHHLAGWYLTVCLRHGSQIGRDWIGYWVDNATKEGLRTKAVEHLTELAQQQGRSVAEVKMTLNPFVLDEVTEAALPDLGFDAQGEMRLSYGSSDVTVRLLADGSLAVESAGKISKGLPRPRKDDDSVAVARAKQAFQQLKTGLAQVLTQAVGLLERAMIVGRSFSAVRFRELFTCHPVLRRIGSGLIFATGDKVFRVTAELGLLDDNGEPVALAADAAARIAHPLELAEQRRDKWLAILASEGINQPFEQLARRVFDKPGDGSLQLPQGSRKPGDFVRRCRSGGWLRGQPQDAGLVYDEWFRLPARGVVIELHHSGYAVADLSWGDDVEIRSLTFTDLSGRHLELSQVDPIAFSEARLAVERIFGP